MNCENMVNGSFLDGVASPSRRVYYIDGVHIPSGEGEIPGSNPDEGKEGCNYKGGCAAAMPPFNYLGHLFNLRQQR